MIIKISSPFLKELETISFSLGVKEALLKGKLGFTKNTLSIHSTTSSTGQSELNITGEIKDLKNAPFLTAQIQGPFELSDLKKLSTTPSQYLLYDNLLGKLNTKFEISTPISEIKKGLDFIKN